MDTTANKQVKASCLFFAVVFFSASRALATVPPDYVELTSAEMKSRQFKVKIRKDVADSSIDLRFPKRVLANRFWLVPHSTNVVIKNPGGEIIARTTSWVADNEYLSIVTSYNHKVSDVSLSVTYACANKHNTVCYGATTFSISSVSKFIDANPDLVNLQPKCRKVSSVPIEINDCTE